MCWGSRGKGYKIAIETLNEGRIGIGGQMVGLAQGALGHALQYARQRKQFGKAIAEFQGCNLSWRRWRWMWKRPGCWSITPHGCGMPECRF
jgi:Acyl-CoA dehydrogenases